MIPQELVQLAHDLHALAVAPWFPYLLIACAGLMAAYERRDRVKAWASGVFQKAKSAAQGVHVKLAKPGLPAVLVVIAVLSLAAQRGFVIPPPGPGPPKPPTPGGPCAVVILHESEDDTVQFGQLSVALRSGVAAKYIADHGHTLDILDDDVTNAQAAELAKHNVGRPSLFIMDARTKATLFEQQIPESMTPAKFVEVLDAHDG